MNYLQRSLEFHINNYLKPNKVVVIYGPRRVGKTELLKQIIAKRPENKLILNGEDQETQELLSERSVRNYARLLNNVELLIIDEAQAISEIGLKLKLMVDSFEGIKILVTGSSVFDLGYQLGEPLVGRAHSFRLYPLAQMEFQAKENYIDTINHLETRLIYGGYPELEQLESLTQKQNYLRELVNAYLLKDILAFEGIRKRDKIVSLLRKIAFRVGSEISMESLGNDLGLNKVTVDRYLDLLSKVFVLYQVRGFSRNLDNEITRKSKWYFYDNGIRNALINNFNSLQLRDDLGILWENYLISERLKMQEYKRLSTANFFWRTHTKQEIDWIEDSGGHLSAFEFKWNLKKKHKTPALWEKGYPKASFTLINKDNYLDFIVPD